MRARSTTLYGMMMEQDALMCGKSRRILSTQNAEEAYLEATWLFRAGVPPAIATESPLKHKYTHEGVV